MLMLSYYIFLIMLNNIFAWSILDYPRSILDRIGLRNSYDNKPETPGFNKKPSDINERSLWQRGLKAVKNALKKKFGKKKPEEKPEAKPVKDDTQPEDTTMPQSGLESFSSSDDDEPKNKIHLPEDHPCCVKKKEKEEEEKDDTPKKPNPTYESEDEKEECKKYTKVNGKLCCIEK